MKKGNRIMKISMIIGIALSILVERVKNSGDEEEGRLPNLHGYPYKYMPLATIISETDKLRLEDYIGKKDTCYTFIKNVLTDENDEINSENTTDIIVIDHKKNPMQVNKYIYTCFYREVEENEITKKKCIPYEEITGEEKKILIALEKINPKIIAQIQEAKNRIANPKEDTQIKEAIELMKRMLNQTMYRFYTDNAIYNADISNADTEMKIIKEQLEKIGMPKAIAYSLFSRINISRIQKRLANLSGSFEDIVRDIEKILYNNNLSNPITENNEKDMKRIFLEDSRRIAAQIIDRKQNYDKRTDKEIRNDYYDVLKMFIDILTDGKVDNHMYINIEKLKKEIENENEEEIKNILYEVVKTCLLKYNGKLSIGNLHGEINNSNKDDSTKTETELSISKETKEKVNKMLNRIINSDNVKTNIYMIVKEAKPWNKDLVSLMCKKLLKYTEFNGTKETLIKEIAADNSQIASEILNNRKESYSTHKNMSAIRTILNNELMEIKRIIKKKKDTVKLERDVAAKENEEIITLLENMTDKTSKPEDTTEEEKKIKEALEYILKGKYNFEEEQRIIEVLDKIAQGKYTPEEETNRPQDKQEDPQRHIRSILSEIAEEFIKDEDYQVTYKTINNKKKEIVDMVVEKTSAIFENKNRDLLRAKEIFKDIVENIADVLIDNVIDRKQHKGFKAVKEEIENEKNYININSQDPKKICNVTFKFLEKYTNFNPNDKIVLHGFKFAVSYTYITQLINSFIKGQNLLSDKSYEKLTDLLCIFAKLCKVDVEIDILKTYNEFWLNPVSFNYYNKIMKRSNHKFSFAAIKYKTTINGKLYENKVTPSDDNLQAFRRARTVQDINNIDKIDRR